MEDKPDTGDVQAVAASLSLARAALQHVGMIRPEPGEAMPCVGFTCGESERDARLVIALAAALLEMQNKRIDVDQEARTTES